MFYGFCNFVNTNLCTFYKNTFIIMSRCDIIIIYQNNDYYTFAEFMQKTTLTTKNFDGEKAE